MSALFERLAARAGAAVPLAVPGLQLVPKGAIALAEHVNRYYRVFTGADPQNVAVRLPPGGGSFEVRHSATAVPMLRVTDAGLDFPAGGIGTGEIADGAVTSAKILDNEIVDADINGAANIVVTKLLHVGANNVLKSNGTNNVAGQVSNADIAPAGTAQIAINKLLHVGAGNVLRSDGAQNVAGQVVTGDIANGTILDADINAAANINGSKLLDNSIGSAKLAGGIPVPANSITTNEILNGTLLTADLAAGAITQFAYGNMTPGSVTTSPTLVAVPMSPTCDLNGVLATSQVLIVGYFTVVSNSAGAGIAISISVDGVAITSEFVCNAPGVNINIGLSPSVVHLPTAGFHRYGMLWRTTVGQVTAGSGQLYAFEIKR